MFDNNFDLSICQDLTPLCQYYLKSSTSIADIVY